MSVAHTIRVLIVDDHEIIRTGITYSLSAYHDLELVGEANSGQEALRLCSETQPDVVLMDMLMPGMDGVQTTEAIRKEHPQVQVLALTSFYDRDLCSRPCRPGPPVTWSKVFQPANLPRPSGWLTPVRPSCRQRRPRC